MKNQRNSLSVAKLPMRTTSSLEAFHSVLNRTIAKGPNFFKFIERLRLHESRAADRMHNLAHDILPDKQFQARLKRDQDRDEKIRHHTGLLCNGAITPEEFLDAMAAENKGGMYPPYLVFL